jgi:hypothetical protein
MRPGESETSRAELKCECFYDDVMDTGFQRRGLMSLQWFLGAHGDELPRELQRAFGGGPFEGQDVDALQTNMDQLSAAQGDELCHEIIAVHREYFGSMNGRELCGFVKRYLEVRRSADAGAEMSAK